jgi:hypothetical protein
LTPVRLLASLDQKNLIPPKDNGSDSDDWLVRVFSFHFETSAPTFPLPLEGKAPPCGVRFNTPQGNEGGKNLRRDELVLWMLDREDGTVGVMHHFFGYASDEYMG